MTYSVLVIGGEPTLRGKLTSVLREAGFAVAAAPDFSLTLFKQNGFKPDIVVMDEALPGQDPIEACLKLRNVFGIPVVLLGTDSSDEAWWRVMEADADGYLLKPIGYRELIARIRAILRRYPAVSGKRESPTNEGLTRIEILIVVAIVILLGVVVVPRLMEAMGG